MKKLLLTFIILLPLFSFSQDCEYEINDIDKFTKQKKIVTESVVVWKDIWSGYSLTMKAKNINNNYYLWMRYSKSDVFSIHEGSSLYLLDVNDKSIQLKAAESVVANIKYKNPFCTVDYILTKEDVEELKKSKIKAVRFYTPDGYIEHDVKEKNMSNISQIINCIE